MAVDGQLVARTVGELRATLPQEGDLLASLGRVVEAARTVVGVDGTGLTLAHEDGVPRWVAVSDAAMELLEQVQHDFGEGPCLAAFAEDRVVAVEDLGSERVWDRIAVVVGQLQVRGVLSVPVRLASQPVGTLDVYATQPRAWSPGEVEALGAFAMVTAELVSTGVELANREVEVAQLRHALASRVWIEQAKGVLARHSSSCGDGQGRPRASWPTSPKRSSRTPNASGSLLSPSTTPGSGRLRSGPGRPSRRCTRARPDWPNRPRPWTGPRTTPTPGSGLPTSATGLLMNATTSPMNATTWPTNASGPPTSASGTPAKPSRAVGCTERPGPADHKAVPRRSNRRVWRPAGRRNRAGRLAEQPLAMSPTVAATSPSSYRPVAKLGDLVYVHAVRLSAVCAAHASRWSGAWVVPSVRAASPALAVGSLA